jgi:hypothetical protein
LVGVNVAVNVGDGVTVAVGVSVGVLVGPIGVLVANAKPPLLCVLVDGTTIAAAGSVASGALPLLLNGVLVANCPATLFGAKAIPMIINSTGIMMLIIRRIESSLAMAVQMANQVTNDLSLYARGSIKGSLAIAQGYIGNSDTIIGLSLASSQIGLIGQCKSVVR